MVKICSDDAREVNVSGGWIFIVITPNTGKSYIELIWMGLGKKI
jgi:hypothetical protein